MPLHSRNQCQLHHKARTRERLLLSLSHWQRRRKMDEKEHSFLYEDSFWTNFSYDEVLYDYLGRTKFELLLYDEQTNYDEKCEYSNEKIVVGVFSQ